MKIAKQPRSTTLQSQSNADDDEIKRKYHLASELSQTIDMTQINEKIINTFIQFSIHEILAIFDDIMRYLHE